MDLWFIIGRIQRFLYVPPRCILIYTFSFLVIVNALVVHHSTATLQSIYQTAKIQKLPGNQPTTPYKLKVHLNYSPPQRLTCGDGLRKLKKIPENIPTNNLSSDQIHALIMVSFYMGYAVTHMSGKGLTGRFGNKRTLALSLAFTAFCSIFTVLPVSYWGLNGFIVINLLLGVSEGPVFPSLRSLIIDTIIPLERGLAEHMTLDGGHIGIFLINLMSGILVPYFNSPWVFYSSVVCALICFIFVIAFCFNSHESNSSIEEEIHCSILSASSYSPYGVSWWHSLITPPPWSLIYTTIQQDWAQSLIVTELRKIFEDQRNYHCWNNGRSCLKLFLPFMFNWFVPHLLSIVIDVLLYWHIVDINESRNLESFLVANTPRISTDFTSCILSNESNDFTTIFNCMLAVFGNYYAVIKLNSLESPNFTEATMTVTKELGSITNIIAPYMDNLLREEGAVQNMRSFLWVISAIFRPDLTTIFEESQHRTENT